MSISWVGIICMAFYLVVVRPALSFITVPKWNKRLQGPDSPWRMRYYRNWILRMTILSIMAAGSLLPFHVSGSQLGLQLLYIPDAATAVISHPWIALMYEFAVAGCIVMLLGYWVWPFVLKERKPPMEGASLDAVPEIEETSSDEEVEKGNGAAPITVPERWVWLVASAVNAIADQLVFIGFLSSILKLVWPVSWWWIWIPGIVAVVYGLERIGHGWKTASDYVWFGFMYAFVYVMTHSLLPGIVFLFLRNAAFSILPTSVRLISMRKWARRLFLAAHFVLAIVITFGMNTWIRNQPVDARAMLQSDASSWSRMNDSQRVQVIREAMVEDNVPFAKTPQASVQVVDTWEGHLAGVPALGFITNRVLTVNALIVMVLQVDYNMMNPPRPSSQPS